MKRYLLIGNSKAAKNFSAYLKSKGINHKKTALRKLKFISKKLNFDAFFILTKDDKIISTYNKYLKNLYKPVFHFSGCIYHPYITSMHPIFSFNKKTISKEEFEKIIFTSEKPNEIKKNLPWFKNKIIQIKPSDKPYYHALLTIYFSFPFVIKNIVEKEIKKFNIKPNYLNTIFRKKFTEKKITLTGPLIRNDKKTLKKHLKILKGKKFYKLYNEIIKLWRIYGYKSVI